MSTQLVLGVVGAAVGSFFGMPQLGWLAGATLGSVLDPQVIRQEGPRLSDLKIQTSTWGKMIPIVYGRARIAGNVIWSSDIQETKHSHQGSAKGGPQTENTTYTYAIDVAISLCAGPIFGVRKIWANSQLIYNSDPSAGPATMLASASNDIVIYSGSETQLPDPTLEAALGSGKVPAYRGQAYVVLNQFQLADYGNRLPNFEFEVVQEGSTLGLREVVFDSSNTVSIAAYSNILQRCFVLSVEEGMVRLASRDGSTQVLVYTSNGRYVGKDAFRQRETELLSVFPALIGFTEDITLVVEANLTKASPNQNFPWTMLRKNGQLWLPPEIPDNEIIVSAVLSADKRLLMLFTTTWNAAGGFHLAGRWYQYRLDGSLLRSGEMHADQGGVMRNIVSINGRCCINSGGLALESDADYVWSATSKYLALFQIQPQGDLVRIYQTALRTVYDDVALYADNGLCLSFYEHYFQANARKPTVAPQDIALQRVVKDQCVRVGMDPSVVDVSRLNQTVTGYVITSQSSVRDRLTQLQKTYAFDVVESEGQLKCLPRGGAPVATIALDELAAQPAPGNAEAPEPLKITRLQEAELPASVAVRYVDANGDYQLGTEVSRRLLTQSTQDVTEDLAIVMSRDKAAQVAEVLLYEAFVSRTGFQFQTARKYAYLEPADVVLVQTDSERYRMRLIKKSDDDGLLNFQAVADDALIYDSHATGATQYTAVETLDSPGITRIEFLDIPLLRDTDNDAGLYVAMSGYLDQWKGAVLYRADDNLSFAALGMVEHDAVMGLTQTALPGWSGLNLPDESAVMEVNVIRGTLASISMEALINGGNVALVGNEVIQFRSAILIATNTYRLYGLLRGRLGTGTYANTHKAGERFVLLGMNGTLRVNEGTSAIHAQRYYKAVSAGQRLARAGSYAYTNQANGLKPYAPVHAAAARQPNHDWQCRWTRCTRIDGVWRNNVDAALGEASEAYEVEIMNGSAVVRTISSNVPFLIYTAAQQIADFGSVSSGLSIRIYQLSAVVGRGDPRLLTL